MRITSKGQVTIPADIREKAGLLPNTEVEFEFDGESVRILPAVAKSGRGRLHAAIERMRGSATVRLTTDEIMSLTRGS